jgi:hypothetical protein
MNYLEHPGFLFWTFELAFTKYCCVMDKHTKQPFKLKGKCALGPFLSILVI